MECISSDRGFYPYTQRAQLAPTEKQGDFFLMSVTVFIVHCIVLT